jgi:hypothetical protein
MRGGGGLTLQELQDHNKNFREKKIRKRQEQGATMFGGAAPILPSLSHTPLKGEGAKMVTHLTNVRLPLLIKGDTH